MYTDSDKEHGAIREKIKKLEEQWIEGDKSTREAKVKEFPNPVLAVGKKEVSKGCPRCSSESFKFEEVKEGCRNNGDAWGYLYNICQTCGWATKKFWDDYCED